MSDCWAATLGNCSTKLSKEHILTAGLFLNDDIYVQGLPWCADQPKQIGLKNLTSKILCTTHNSALSPVDGAAIHAIKVLRESTRLTNQRIALKIKQPRILHFKMDGLLLERWFLKTLVNIAYEGPYRIGAESSEPGQPSKGLVEIAFGVKRFESKAGLYLVEDLGETIDSDDRLRVLTLLDKADCLVGGLFYFRGYRFLLHLHHAGLAERFQIVGPSWTLHRSKPLHHLAKIRVAIGKRLSHVIEIRWS